MLTRPDVLAVGGSAEPQWQSSTDGQGDEWGARAGPVQPSAAGPALFGSALLGQSLPRRFSFARSMNSPHRLDHGQIEAADGHSQGARQASQQQSMKQRNRWDNGSHQSRRMSDHMYGDSIYGPL